MNIDYTEQLNEATKAIIDQDVLETLILLTIANIGPDVSWDGLEADLSAKIPADDQLLDNLHASVFTLFQRAETSQAPFENTLHKLTFTDAQTAQAFYAFTQHSFPIINTEYPKVSGNEIILTDDQLFFCRLGAKLNTGELPSDFLSDYFLKTLRADEFDFSDKFIRSFFPNTDGTRRLQNLRPTNRRLYTIAGDGTVIKRSSRVSREASQKEGYSQIQSITLLDTQALTPAFGFNKDRNHKLYGTLTHQHDVLISRLLLNDGGTVSRPFDADTEEAATRETSQIFKTSQKQLLFHSGEQEKFKTENIKERRANQKTNEVLARIKFNIYRQLICICSYNLESTYLAIDFSNELLEVFSDYAKKEGVLLNPKFKFPIIFYVKKSNLDIQEYNNGTHKIFKLTRNTHKRLMDDTLMPYKPNLTHIPYHDQNYEFLLGLNTISPDILLSPDSKGIPLALQMLKKGYTRMLFRLLRPERATNRNLNSEPLSDIVFNALIAANAFQKNDPIISKLIIAEAFTIADNIIAATQSDKNELIISVNVRLRDHIAQTGNPRHFHYMGLDETLLLAAEKNCWVAIRLCIKEYSHIRDETIQKLFIYACNRNHLMNEPDIVFFLTRCKITRHTLHKVVDSAIFMNNSALVLALLSYCQNPCFLTTHFSIGALQLVINSIINVAPQLTPHSDPTRLTKNNYIYFSCLVYSVLYHSDKTSELFEFENNTQDVHTTTRIGLAVDLAHAQKNKTALAFFENKNISVNYFIRNNPSVSPCYYIFEAFFANLPSVAEYRLNFLDKEFGLNLPKDQNFINNLSTLSDFFDSTFTQFDSIINISNQHYIKSFISCLITLSFKYKNLKLITTFKKIFIEKYKLKENAIEELIIESSLEILSPNNADLIEAMIKTSPHKDLWRKMILEEFNDIDRGYSSKKVKSATVFYLLVVLHNLGETLFDKELFIKAFEIAKNSRNATLTSMILKDSPLTESIKEELLFIAMNSGPSLYFHYLITHFNFTITKKLLTMKQSQSFEFKYITILQEIQKEEYKDKFNPWDFFNIWLNYSVHFDAYKTTAFRTLAAGFLPPHIIMHFTLISLVFLFTKSYPSVVYDTTWPNIQKLLEREIFSTDSFSLNSEFRKYTPTKNYNYDELLNTLNHYFIQSDSIPDEASITQTYNKVKTILFHNKAPLDKTPFFPSNYNGHWDYESYNYLNDIDDLIKLKQNNTLNAQSIDPFKEIKEAFPHQKIH